MTTAQRFLHYVSFPTMSDENSETCPSTARQLTLARELADELRALGLADASVDDNGYVTATLPANAEGFTRTVGYIAHMDTSDAAPDAPIVPRTVHYTGGDIVLNEAQGIVMREADYPRMRLYRNQHMIVTDGTTLLGADDKAGVAEIMTALERLIASGAPHGTVKVAFTPDEEIGRGADRFPVEAFGADFAYTVDGGAVGEIEYENFNAADAHITFRGVSIHPGDAKDRMKNASLIACEFNALLPADEIPAKTSGYEGFHHLISMEGGIEHARLRYIIRDHDREKFEQKKQQMLDAAAAVNARYGADTATVALRDSYYNMKQMIDPHPHILARAEQAMRDCGMNPTYTPVRGGTDGARLSFMGLPCPNLCTGGENFHSRFEFVTVESLEHISDMLCRLMQLAGE